MLTTIFRPIHTPVSTFLWLAAFIAATATAASAVAGVDPVSAEFAVSTYTADAPDAPVVAVSALDEFLVVWENTNLSSSGDPGVVVRTFDSSGSPRTGESALSTLVGAQAAPYVRSLDDGSFVAVWVRQSDTLAAGSDIVARIFDAAGAALGAEFLVNLHTTDDQTRPVVALQSGGFVVAWESYRQDGPMGAGIVARRFTNGGAAGLEFVVNSYTTHEQVRPSVSELTTGFVVAWESYGQEGGMDYGVFAQRFDTNGSAVGTEFQVNTVTADEQRHARVSGLGNGGFVVVWQDYRADGDFGYGVVARTYDQAGQSLTAPFVVNGYGTGEQVEPDVVALSDGGFAAVWVSEAQPPDAGYAIYGKRYSAAAAAVSADTRVSSVADEVHKPSIASGNAALSVAWAAVSLDADSEGEIALRRFFAPGVTCGDANANGALSATDALIALQAAVGSLTCPAYVCDANGSGGVLASDAFLILRASVGQPAALVCPA